MKLTVMIAGLAAACLLGGPTAQAQIQPNSCLVLNNGAPRMVSGTPATSSNQNQAVSRAQSNWSQQAMAFGGEYQSWFKATNRGTPCTATKPTRSAASGVDSTPTIDSANA